MAAPYRPKVSEGAGAGGDFNPKCNQSTGTRLASPSIPSAAKVAEEGTRRWAAQRADQEAYRRAIEAARGKPKSDPKRWLSNEDLA